MVVKSNVGGRFELAEFGVVFQAGEVIDLSFFAKEEDLYKSRELQIALEKKFLIPQSATRVSSNFRVLSQAASVVFPRDSTVRRALFVAYGSQDPSAGYDTYTTRDVSARRAIVLATSNVTLLKMVVERGDLLPIVATARGRLTSMNRREV